jgi:hypothetical protein
MRHAHQKVLWQVNEKQKMKEKSIWKTNALASSPSRLFVLFSLFLSFVLCAAATFFGLVLSALQT